MPDVLLYEKLSAHCNYGDSKGEIYYSNVTIKYATHNRYFIFNIDFFM